MQFDLLETAVRLAIYFVPYLFAICFHEFAHGYVAKLRGDNTAEMMGRLTLNPVAHADMIGTVMMPILTILASSPVFFGWAKPVPVNPRNLKNPKVDLFWIALAGPGANIFLAIISAVALGLVYRWTGGTGYQSVFVGLLDTFIGINLFLAIFNMIPLHPLDGGKVLARFLPAQVNYKLEQNEMMLSFVLLLLVFSGALAILVGPVRWGHGILQGIALQVASII